MFEKITSAAEKLATNVSQSRRGFLGRLGKVALGAAAVASGLLVSEAQAKTKNKAVCCDYRCMKRVGSERGLVVFYVSKCQSYDSPCDYLFASSPAGSCALISATPVPSC